MTLDAAQKQLEGARELVQRARARLAGIGGVQSVFFSLSGDPETLGLPVLIVLAERDIGDLADHANALGMPLRVRALDPTAPEVGDPVLRTRGNPPLGGYRVAGPRIAGTLGSVGYLQNDPAAMAFVSAAHVFRTQDGGLSDDAWQPLPPALGDIIGRGPVTTFESVDVVFYPILQVTRAWAQESRLYGLGLVNGIIAPELGIEVRKVGQSTGLTRGIISLVNGSLFIVEPIDPSAPLSLAGDSGALWVDVKNRAVGIHQRGTDTNLAIALSMVPLARHGDFLFY